jgi:hypothetical protein
MAPGLRAGFLAAVGLALCALSYSYYNSLGLSISITVTRAPVSGGGLGMGRRQEARALAGSPLQPSHFSQHSSLTHPCSLLPLAPCLTSLPCCCDGVFPARGGGVARLAPAMVVASGCGDTVGPW